MREYGAVAGARAEVTDLARNRHTAVTYALVVRGARLLVAATTVAFLFTLSTGAGASDRATAALRLDGVAFRPEVAKTPAQRSRGLMYRTQAPKDGMLFVFPKTTTGGFWMKNTLVPLTIVFFDSTGRRVRKLSMTPCRKDPCPIYDPGRSYRFALELRASDTRRGAIIGPRAALGRLAEAAT
jgi:uncharacterized membrane protein (UPF0127 family)